MCYMNLHLHYITIYPHMAFSALTLLVGRQEELPACNNSVMRCWCDYLSAARCRLFAYGPADATAIPKPHHFLPHLSRDRFYLSGTGLPRLSWAKRLLNGSSSSSSSSSTIHSHSVDSSICPPAPAPVQVQDRRGDTPADTYHRE